MKKNNRKKWFCICIVLSFVMALLENLPCGYAVSAGIKAYPSSAYSAKEQHDSNFRMESALPLAAKKLLSADRGSGIDDFQMVTESCSQISNLRGTVGNGTLLFLLAAILLVLGNSIIEYSQRFPKRQTVLYQVIYYIHRSDGKKKSHSDQKIFRMGGYKSGNRYKIQNIINRRRKGSAIFFKTDVYTARI